MSAQDVLEVIMWGSPLFIATNADGVLGFAVMEVVQYPSRKVANILCAGGDKGFLSVALHELLPRLKAWGAEQGADTFALTGRPGWVRLLRDFEAMTHITLWADLNGEGRRIVEQSADKHNGAVEGRSALSH